MIVTLSKALEEVQLYTVVENQKVPILSMLALRSWTDRSLYDGQLKPLGSELGELAELQERLDQLPAHRARDQHASQRGQRWAEFVEAHEYATIPQEMIEQSRAYAVARALVGLVRLPPAEAWQA